MTNRGETYTNLERRTQRPQPCVTDGERLEKVQNDAFDQMQNISRGVIIID